MNKYGIFYAYWAKNWEVDLSNLIQYLRKADKIGFDILELHSSAIENLSRLERKKLKKAANERSIHLTFSTTLRKDIDISSENKKIRKNGINYLKNLINTVHEMDSDTLSGVIYGAWGKKVKSFEKKPYLTRSIESVKEIIGVAEDLDILCNVEPVNRFEQFILNTCEEALDYLKKVNSSNLKINLDTYHMNVEEDDLHKAIIKAGDNLGHFHVGENNRKLPGRGHIGWDKVVEGLKKICYSGYIVMEPFLIPGGNVASDVKLFRDLSRNIDLDKEARRGLNFLKEKFKKS